MRMITVKRNGETLCGNAPPAVAAITLLELVESDPVQAVIVVRKDGTKIEYQRPEPDNG